MEKLTQIEDFSLSFLVLVFLELRDYVLASINPFKSTNDICARIIVFPVPVKIGICSIELPTVRTEV